MIKAKKLKMNAQHKAYSKLSQFLKITTNSILSTQILNFEKTR